MTTALMLDIARHSQAKGNAKLVLMLIASYAHRDGTHSEASLSTLAREAGLSRRQVNTLVHFLVETGHVTVEANAGTHGTNRYAVQRPWTSKGNHFPRATTSLGEITAPLGKPLPPNRKENKDLKNQLGENIALGQSLPQSLGQALPQSSEASPPVQVTTQAVHVVSTYGLSANFLQTLQGKDPASSNDPPAPADAPPGGPSPVPPVQRPRSVSFDERKFYLGEPCQDDPTHRYWETRESLRLRKDDQCRLCALRASQQRQALQAQARQPPP